MSRHLFEGFKHLVAHLSRSIISVHSAHRSHAACWRYITSIFLELHERAKNAVVFPAGRDKNRRLLRSMDLLVICYQDLWFKVPRALHFSPVGRATLKNITLRAGCTTFNHAVIPPLLEDRMRSD